MKSKTRRTEKWKPEDSVEAALRNDFRRTVKRRFTAGRQVCVYCGRSSKDCAEVRINDLKIGKNGVAMLCSDCRKLKEIDDEL